MQDSIRQRHEVEPQRWATWNYERGTVTISAGEDKWISSEKVVEITQ